MTHSVCTTRLHELVREWERNVQITAPKIAKWERWPGDEHPTFEYTDRPFSIFTPEFRASINKWLCDTFGRDHYAIDTHDGRLLMDAHMLNALKRKAKQVEGTNVRVVPRFFAMRS